MTAYTTSTLGNRKELDSLTITVKDVHMLPVVDVKVTDKDGKAITPAPTSVAEGSKIYLTLSRAMATVAEAPYISSEPLKVTFSAGSGSTATAQDYRLSETPVTIAAGKSATIELEALEDDDVVVEMLVLDATVEGGTAANGPGSNVQPAAVSLTITDTTGKLVEAKSEAVVKEIIYDAKEVGEGPDKMFNPKEMIEVDASLLFIPAPGVTVEYSASPDDRAVLDVVTTGSMVKVTAVKAGGPAHVTITATATSAGSSVMIVEQVDANVAQVLFPLTVVNTALMVESVTAEPMEIMEGSTSTITATANRMVEASDGTVKIDLVVVGDAKLSAESITIAANSMSGTVTLTATEDDDTENETVTVIASGSVIDGNMQVAIAVIDNDKPAATVTAKSDEVVQAVFDSAVAAVRTGPDWVEGGAAATVTMSDLFIVGEGASPVYLGMSSDEMVVSATNSGMMLTLKPLSDGMATITVTAVDNASGDSDNVSGMVTVADLPFMIETVTASAAMVEEGGDGITITATANKMVEGDNVEVMLMRDGASTASLDDYELDPPLITIMTGDDMGALTLMAEDDVDVEGMERLTLVAMMDGMSVGTVMIEIADNDMESTFTLSGPDEMNLVEGQSYMLTVTADPAVPMDTEVMIMRDRSMSDADDADYTAEPVMINAGETVGTTMLMIEDDGPGDAGHGMPEMLVVFGMVDGMETNSLSFYTWDMAVPALPLIAQLLLAAFLAIGGYRRYLRR